MNRFLFSCLLLSCFIADPISRFVAIQDVMWSGKDKVSFISYFCKNTKKLIHIIHYSSPTLSPLAQNCKMGPLMAKPSHSAKPAHFFLLLNFQKLLSFFFFFSLTTLVSNIQFTEITLWIHHTDMNIAICLILDVCQLTALEILRV